MPARRERLFLALWPEPAVREALARLARERLPPGLGSPVPAANLHLTLVFLGALAPSVRERLEAGCAGIHLAPIVLDLVRLGCWPRSGVVWSAPERTPPALARLVEALRAVAAACAIAADSRPFAAHVTLARRVPARDGRGAGLGAEHPPIRWSAGRFALVRSESGPRGGRYQPVCAWPLTAPCGDDERRDRGL